MEKITPPVVCACGKVRGENEFFDDCDHCSARFCKECTFPLFHQGEWVLSYCKACGEEHEKAQVIFRLQHKLDMAMLEDEMGGEPCQMEEFFTDAC